VQKPARYTGGEYNQILKDKEKVDLRVAFCFPDTYEIGMSNLGMSILYHTMNSLDYVWCERVFAPWGDMYEEMKKAGLSLYALESGDSLDQFDALAFSIGYEMAYTTVLDMIDQARLPLRSADRKALLPLVFAGGSAAVNAEPIADFIDLFVIGEADLAQQVESKESEHHYPDRQVDFTVKDAPVIGLVGHAEEFQAKGYFNEAKDDLHAAKPSAALGQSLQKGGEQGQDGEREGECQGESQHRDHRAPEFPFSGFDEYRTNDRARAGK
jgi:hypothetical protein